ncbi:Ubiquitin carboxyl-terminal hydrolase 3 [Geodia barretti]|nr:Ubiquitin carboxyl-terminal hydrolase 3 [Geodia barretti]
MDQSLSVFCYRHDEFVVNENDTISSMRTEIQRNLRTSNSSPSSSNDTEEEEEDSSPPRKLIKLENGDTCPVRTTGLQNLGNTCFMNSILQSLSNIEQFYVYFSKLPSLRPADAGSTHQYPTRRKTSLEELSLVEEVRKVSCGLWQEGDSSLSPDSLFSIIWRLVPQFRGYQQQDAHEFMRYLLDKLHTELLAGSLGAGSDNTTIVSQIFGGTLQSDVRCLACCTDSRKHDPILDVSLDIPDRFLSRRKGERHQDCSILDCLASYTGLETLEETEWYYCHRCKTREPSTKRLFLHALPNVLCIHLKRFRFTSCVRTKLSLPIGFPLSGLDMGQFTVAGGRRGGGGGGGR